METAQIERNTKNLEIKKETPTNHNTTKQNLSTLFGHLSEIIKYEPQIFDQQYQRDLYRVDDLYHQKKLEFKHNFNKTLEHIEVGDLPQTLTYHTN